MRRWTHPIAWSLFGLNLLVHCQCLADSDPEALQLVRDAIATNAAAFPKGKLIASVRKQDQQICTARAEVAWEGESTRWEYDLQHKSVGAERPSTNQSGVRLLEKPNDFYFYDRANRLLQRIPDKSRTYYQELRLRPDQVWYSYQTDPKRPFAKYINPDTKPESVKSITARRIENDQIEIVRLYGDGLNTTFIASLRHGGNIVQYHRAPNPDAPPGSYGYGSSGELEWAPVGDGRFYLKSYTWREFRSDPDEPFVSYEMNVESFDPNPQFPPNYFTLAGLEVAPGTKVEDLGPPERTYTYGKEPVSLRDEELNRLADQQRRRGFAVPERQEAQ